MKINYGATGTTRKWLAKAVSDIIGQKAVYQGIPSCAYQIGPYLVTYDGALQAEHFDREVIVGLRDRGYVIPNYDEVLALCDEAPFYDESVCFSLPEDYLTGKQLEMLRKYVSCRKMLFNHAFATTNTDIVVRDGKILFPWFLDPSPNEYETYCRFIRKLCDYIASIKTVASKNRTIINEKLAMRDVLIHIGYNGDEYKEDRRLLLHRLEGDSAYLKHRMSVIERLLAYEARLSA